MRRRWESFKHNARTLGTEPGSHSAVPEMYSCVSLKVAVVPAMSSDGFNFVVGNESGI